VIGCSCFNKSIGKVVRFVCKGVCVYVFMYVCTCVFMYVYICRTFNVCDEI